MRKYCIATLTLQVVLIVAAFIASTSSNLYWHWISQTVLQATLIYTCISFGAFLYALSRIKSTQYLRDLLFSGSILPLVVGFILAVCLLSTVYDSWITNELSYETFFTKQDAAACLLILFLVYLPIFFGKKYTKTAV